ncbi:MAG TPA: von Willebrand factor type A domain-containing protein, partial [Leptospiraceae bacterium]|nr:von Willebrand factor type A domain-containing protein [Leptospiraceae bacterium]
MKIIKYLAILSSLSLIYCSASEDKTYSIAQSEPAREMNKPTASYKNKQQSTKIYTKDQKPSSPKTKPEMNTASGVSDSEEYNTEQYDKITDNPFLDVKENPLSTFSIDVDTASYS